MAAPNGGPTQKKFTNGDVLRCFNEEHRRRVGKIELSASEITEILNSEILADGKSVTRQAVDKRLNELAGDELKKNKHGRSYLYARDTDLDDLFSSPAPVGSASGGGSGGGGYKEPTKNTSSKWRGWLSPDKQTMDVPALILLALVGIIGWRSFNAVYSKVREQQSDYVGAAWLTLTASGVVATFGALAYPMLQTLTAAQNGVSLLAVSWLVGFAVLVGILYYAGGVFGLSAKVAEAPFKSGERTRVGYVNQP